MKRGVPFHVQHAATVARRKADAALAEKGTPVERRPEAPEASARRKVNARALAAAGIRVDPSRAPRAGRR